MGLSPRVKRSRAGMLVLGAGLLTGVAAVERPATGSGAPSRTTAPAGEAAAILVDYPA
jgi:hypothetical protein